MTSPTDRFDLQRFVEAQDRVYDTVLSELRQGQKRTHWMWYIFPQIEGLGQSAMSALYAVQGLEEARRFLEHPLLGPRLVECSQTLLDLEGRSVSVIFGYPDDLKFHSSMTLFARVAGPDSIFARVLKKYFLGQEDANTLKKLARPETGH